VDSSGRARAVLLVGADGSAHGEELLPFVGDLVEFEGEREMIGDLEAVRVDARGLRRR